MKIRTDFVTNSSSSSFVAINVKSKTLDNYLKENNLTNLFMNIGYEFSEFEIPMAELDKSMSKSLIDILEKIIEESSWSEDSLGANYDEMSDLREYIKENGASIDSEARGKIELKYSDSDGAQFAFFQSLEYIKHHGKLVKWPCENVWSGEGWDKVNDYAERLMNGEIEELEDLSYIPIYDIVWDNKQLIQAVDMTGVIEEFDVVDISNDEEKKDTNRIGVIGRDSKNWGSLEGHINDGKKWMKTHAKDIFMNPSIIIKDKIFVFTGCDILDEWPDIIRRLEDMGGVKRGAVSGKTDYLICNPIFAGESKLRKVFEQRAKGKDVKIIHIEDFLKSINMTIKTPKEKQVELKNQNKKKKRNDETFVGDKNSSNLPKREVEGLESMTMAECEEEFVFRVDEEKVILSGARNDIEDVVVPGTVDGMPVAIADGGFYGVDSVVISDGVIEIGHVAFHSCTFEEVIVPGSVKSIGEGVFCNNNNLKSITLLEGVEHLEVALCGGCGRLKEVKLPNTIKTIGGYDIFWGTPWLEKQGDFLIVNGILVKYLGTAKNVLIPEGVICINTFSFAFNRKIESVRIPESVKSIGICAFSNCENLVDIKFPAHELEIEEEAFKNTAWEKNNE